MRRRRIALALLCLLALSAGAPRASAQEAPGPREILAEVRIHGNHTTPDAVVLETAGLTLGQAVTPDTIPEARRRIRDSGRFDAVEIRKRYRSLTTQDEIALIIVVREQPVPEDPVSPTPAVVKPFKRLVASGMVLPVLDYTEGYGFTYGARISFVHLFGRDGRLSVPLTWGGVRRVAAEVDKRLAVGPLDRLVGGISLSQRENPFYEVTDRRTEAWAGLGARVAGPLRAGVRASVADVAFGELDERTATYVADLLFDTRHDPIFPRNAVYLSAALDAIRPEISVQANRYRMEARGYVGLVRQSVLSLRWIYTASDAPLPPYERALLGGGSSVRGYRAGYESGDNMMAATAEVRVPFSSPLRIARAGVSFFADAGRAWDHGETARDAPLRHGAGVGLFLFASIFQVKGDFAVRQGGDLRFHFTTGLQF